MSYKRLPLPKPEWPLNLPPDEALKQIKSVYAEWRLELVFALDSPMVDNNRILRAQEAIKKLEDAVPELKELFD
ncbi:MAG: hypothetical protein KGJ86_08985 [Chloroflexota bacterium]|nr:hypothetical protein [Chloroflexota bacterium]